MSAVHIALCGIVVFLAVMIAIRSSWSSPRDRSPDADTGATIYPAGLAGRDGDSGSGDSGGESGGGDSGGGGA